MIGVHLCFPLLGFSIFWTASYFINANWVPLFSEKRAPIYRVCLLHCFSIITCAGLPDALLLVFYLMLWSSSYCSSFHSNLLTQILNDPHISWRKSRNRRTPCLSQLNGCWNGYFKPFHNFPSRGKHLLDRVGSVWLYARMCISYLHTTINMYSSC